MYDIPLHFSRCVLADNFFMFVAAMSSFSPLCFLIMYVFLFIMLSAVLFEFMCSAAAGAAENRVRSWCYVGRPAGRVPSAHFATTNRV